VDSSLRHSLSSVLIGLKARPLDYLLLFIMCLVAGGLAGIAWWDYKKRLKTYRQEFHAVKAPYKATLRAKLIQPSLWQRALERLKSWRTKQ
jgi:hypothetical protein